MSQASITDITALFQSAQDEGSISPAAATAFNIIDIGTDIQAAMGTPVAQVNASSVLLVNIVVDDSGSIRSIRDPSTGQPVGPTLVRDGVNSIKRALLATKQADGIQMCIRYLNGTILCPFVPLSQVPDMTAQNYNPTGSTPLYRVSLASLGTVVAKAQDFSDAGVPVRSVTCLVSDGADTDGGATARQNEAVISDMLRSEMHIVCGMGIADGYTDFNRVFRDMGIPPEWILTPAADQHSIRQAFATVSQSAVRASQVAATGSNFSQTAMGGFGTP